jgi:hypothetical protein
MKLPAYAKFKYSLPLLLSDTAVFFVVDSLKRQVVLFGKSLSTFIWQKPPTFNSPSHATFVDNKIFPPKFLNFEWTMRNEFFSVILLLAAVKGSSLW